MNSRSITAAFLSVSLSFVGWSTSAAADDRLAQRTEVREFIDSMVERHDFSRKELETLFAGVELKPGIVRAISRPAESKPWYKYRPIFVTADRIRQGLGFWREHERSLRRAEAEFGVPPSVIVAILGVETRYGRHTGGYRVVDALSTLAFDYPPRAEFFRDELEEFLLMAREEEIPPDSVSGSYAGAMGKAQFIPSSFRAYAVDFDSDGRRDLWENTDDAIGSVANYFRLHGWKRGGPVAVRARVRDEPPTALLNEGIKPHTTVRELSDKGITPRRSVADEEPAALLSLKTEHGPEYWIVFHNFHVITRYNRSSLYGMAVHQLSRALAAARGEGKTASN